MVPAAHGVDIGFTHSKTDAFHPFWGVLVSQCPVVLWGLQYRTMKFLETLIETRLFCQCCGELAVCVCRMISPISF